MAKDNVLLFAESNGSISVGVVFKVTSDSFKSQALHHRTILEVSKIVLMVGLFSPLLSTNLAAQSPIFSHVFFVVVANNIISNWIVFIPDVRSLPWQVLVLTFDAVAIKAKDGNEEPYNDSCSDE